MNIILGFLSLLIIILVVIVPRTKTPNEKLRHENVDNDYF
jgi:hypothetical protein